MDAVQSKKGKNEEEDKPMLHTLKCVNTVYSHKNKTSCCAQGQVTLVNCG